MADRIRQEAGERAARRRGRGGNGKAQGGGCRFRHGCLADQKDGAAQLLRPAMQTAGRRKVEAGGIAADFQDHGAEILLPCRFLGDPQRIGNMLRAGAQKAAGGKTEQPFKAGGVWKTRFAEEIRKAYPADDAFSPAPAVGSPQQGEEAKGKTCRSSRVPRLKAVNFGERGARDPAPKRAIEFWDSGVKKGAAPLADR